MSLSSFCDECSEPISKEDQFDKSVKQDHFPDDPGIPAETITVPTYRCSNCGYCPVDD